MKVSILEFLLPTSVHISQLQHIMYHNARYIQYCRSIYAVSVASVRGQGSSLSAPTLVRSCFSVLILLGDALFGTFLHSVSQGLCTLVPICSPEAKALCLHMHNIKTVFTRAHDKYPYKSWAVGRS